MFYIFFSFVRLIVLVVCVLVGVAFFTLLERKVLGYAQIRKGPNKVGYLGILQPFSDAIKLFTKERSNPSVTNYYPYYICPVFALFISLIVWFVFPFRGNCVDFDLAVLFFLCCTRLGVYAVLGAGWSSNSKYALLGGLRSVAQTISYEVSLALVLLSFIFLVECYDLYSFCLWQGSLWFIFLIFPLRIVWFASCLAETNRAPFDFAEGESELVSGFNIEYRGGGFALIFIAEYSRILFIRMLSAILFFGGNVENPAFYLFVIFLAFSFLWVRAVIPRFRYDKLMGLAWKSFLPLSLNYLLFFAGARALMWVLVLLWALILT